MGDRVAKSSNLAALNLAQRRSQWPPVVWLVLVVSALICGASSYLLWNASQSWRDINARMQEQQQTKARRDAELRKIRLERRLPANIERERDLRHIKELAGLSWEGLFEAVEIVANRVRGGVSLVSMVPSATKLSEGQVHMTALAASSAVMLFYIDELKKDPRIVRVELSQQQPEDKSLAGVVRFQMDVTWDPSIEVPPSKKPVAVATGAGVLKK